MAVGRVVRHAASSDKGAERIRQRRRLDTLQKDASAAKQHSATAADTAAATDAALADSRQTLLSCRQASQQAEQAFGEARRRAESDQLKLTLGQERAAELEPERMNLPPPLSLVRPTLRRWPTIQHWPPPKPWRVTRLRRHAQRWNVRCRPNPNLPTSLPMPSSGKPVARLKPRNGSNGLMGLLGAFLSLKND